MIESEKKKVLELLRDDKEYYTGEGRKFLSNSDLYTLLNNPKDFRKNSGEVHTALLHGSYFHTAVLEPEKLKNFDVVEASNRNTKIYKEAVIASSEGILLLESEKKHLDHLIETMLNNDICHQLIRGNDKEDVIYETPGIKELFGEYFKGKADIINRNESLIVDIKTTGDISKFKYSAKKFNYDSQAYIYSQIFGYDMVFCVVDKKTGMLGVYECDTQFMEGGRYKVEKAIGLYRKFYKDKTPEETQKLLSNHLIHDHLY